MTRRKTITKSMRNLRTEMVGTVCPVIGCDFVLTPSGPAENSRNVADSAATVEHIRPLADGGSHTISNVAIICNSCQKARNSLFISRGSINIFPREYWWISLMYNQDEILTTFYSELHNEFLSYKARNA